jgi:hypothetical protein
MKKIKNIWPETKGMSWRGKLYEWWYWFIAWRHPHNILILNRPPTWCDKDELIRLAVFEYLVRFIEDEFAMNRVDWDSDPKHQEAAKALLKAYKWIKEERPKAVEKYETLLHNVFGSISWEELDKISKKDAESVHKAERFYEAKDQEILHLIIQYRSYMWT